MSGAGAEIGVSADGQLALLLACFAGRKTAGKARRKLEGQLQAQGDELLDTVVPEVDEKQKASVHDPRRVLWGTVTAVLVWGACGLAGARSGVLFSRCDASAASDLRPAGRGQAPASRAGRLAGQARPGSRQQLSHRLREMG